MIRALLLVTSLALAALTGGATTTGHSAAQANASMVLAARQPAAAANGEADAARLTTLLPEIDADGAILDSREEALSANAAVAFHPRRAETMAPFHFAGSRLAQERATDCLAAAAWYEAGNDPAGQRAVVQVVLNRLRHPAFQRSVCGVVFEGAERRTGCQFTFTCDGAMRRSPGASQWSAARKIAEAALQGAVYGKVGTATHYHTDWVYPAWSPKLDKIAREGTHLFFRWPDGWGRPRAFTSLSTGVEPAIARMKFLSRAHSVDSETAFAQGLGNEEGNFASAGELATTGALPAAAIVATHPEGDAFIVAFSAGYPPGDFPSYARGLCGQRKLCRVMAWVADDSAPAGFPVPRPALDKMLYSYMRDRSFDFERSLFDCGRIQREVRADCMRNRNPGESPETGPIRAS